MTVSFVVAVSRNGVIGQNGGLPWRLPSDLKRFKAITMGKPVIMGRATWDGLPVRPLPGRLNIVMTGRVDVRFDGAVAVHSTDAALAAAGGAPEVCVIGGGAIFQLFLPIVSRIYLTTVDADVEGDTYFPALDRREWKVTFAERIAAGVGDSSGFTFEILEKAR